MPAADDDLSLDDLYRMTAHIYSEQNAGRPPETTFSHFVEVCGMLSSLDRNKPRGEVNVADALCKALGWFFPLMARLKVTSLENLIFRKYPLVCPYCRSRPHQDMKCKSTVGLAPGLLQHDELRQLYEDNLTQKPTGIDSWQEMFQSIYPRQGHDATGRNTLGLMEELGELAEAIRVFDRSPMFVAGEAADVFSYIMGMANEHKLNMLRNGSDFSLETAYLKRYPGMCVACGYPVCRCPHVPEATIGRMAKELPIARNEHLFNGDTIADDDASTLADRVLRRVGGFEQLIKEVPLDRGQANRSVVQITLSLADVVKDEHPEFAQSLQRNALRLLRSTTEAGERRHSLEAERTLDAINEILNNPTLADSGDVQRFGRDFFAAMTAKDVSVLMITSSPQDQDRVRPDIELRTIKESISRQGIARRIALKPLPACRIIDVRRALLAADYDILHFAGHGEATGLLLENDAGDSEPWAFESLLDYVRSYDLQCLILNACYTDEIASLNPPVFTVAMAERIDDEAAIKFAEGFYDALAAGKDYFFAADEGRRAAQFSHPEFKTVTLVPNGTGAEVNNE